MAKIFCFSAFLVVLTLAIPVAAQRGPQGPVGVIAAPVKAQLFSDRIEALGTTKANETVVVTVDTSGKIAEIHFEDGQVVAKGDLLVVLDKSEEEASLRAAEAQLAEAQASYDRAKNLQESSALSRATLQERLAALEQSRAAIQEIKARLDKLIIAAPFDGILGLREVSIGALVQPGDQITTIDDLSQIKVDFEVPAVFLSALQPGLPIAGKVSAFQSREFTGEVRTVNTQVDPVTRTVRVRAVLPNPDLILKPGLLMTITLYKDQRQALLIPEEALFKRGEQNYVYVVSEENGKTIAEQREILIGARQPGIIEVVSGLAEGDLIVSHGTVKVRDGMEIALQAVEEENAPLNELLEQKPASGEEGVSAPVEGG